MSGPVRSAAAGSVLAVRVVPGASRAGIVGLHGDELKVRVCSPPLEGRANEELCEVVAAAVGLRPRDVAVVGGQQHRSKQLAVALDEASLRSRLALWIGPLPAAER